MSAHALEGSRSDPHSGVVRNSARSPHTRPFVDDRGPSGTSHVGDSLASPGVDADNGRSRDDDRAAPDLDNRSAARVECDGALDDVAADVVGNDSASDDVTEPGRAAPLERDDNADDDSAEADVLTHR